MAEPTEQTMRSVWIALDWKSPISVNVRVNKSLQIILVVIPIRNKVNQVAIPYPDMKAVIFASKSLFMLIYTKRCKIINSKCYFEEDLVTGEI